MMAGKMKANSIADTPRRSRSMRPMRPNTLTGTALADVALANVLRRIFTLPLSLERLVAERGSSDQEPVVPRHVAHADLGREQRPDVQRLSLIHISEPTRPY